MAALGSQTCSFKQLVEIVAGGIKIGFIRIKHLLPSSAMVNRTSESNCCSVHGDTRHNFVFSSATGFRYASAFATPIFLTLSLSSPNIIT